MRRRERERAPRHHTQLTAWQYPTSSAVANHGCGLQNATATGVAECTGVRQGGKPGGSKGVRCGANERKDCALCECARVSGVAGKPMRPCGLRVPSRLLCDPVRSVPNRKPSRLCSFFFCSALCLRCAVPCRAVDTPYYSKYVCSRSGPRTAVLDRSLPHAVDRRPAAAAVAALPPVVHSSPTDADARCSRRRRQPSKAQTALEQNSTRTVKQQRLHSLARPHCASHACTATTQLASLTDSARRRERGGQQPPACHSPHLHSKHGALATTNNTSVRTGAHSSTRLLLPACPLHSASVPLSTVEPRTHRARATVPSVSPTLPCPVTPPLLLSASSDLSRPPSPSLARPPVMPAPIVQSASASAAASSSSNADKMKAHVDAHMKAKFAHVDERKERYGQQHSHTHTHAHTQST